MFTEAHSGKQSLLRVWSRFITPAYQNEKVLSQDHHLRLMSWVPAPKSLDLSVAPPPPVSSGRGVCSGPGPGLLRPGCGHSSGVVSRHRKGCWVVVELRLPPFCWGPRTQHWAWQAQRSGPCWLA